MWKPYKITEQIKIPCMYSLFEAHYENGYSFPGETHNFWECVYVISGGICASGDERVYNMNRGEIIFHKPLELHKFKVTSESGAQLLIFSFSLEGSLAKFYENKVFRLTPMQSDAVASFVHFLQRSSGIRSNGTVSTPPDKYLEGFSSSPVYAQTVAAYLYRLFLSLYNESTETVVSAAPDALIFSQAVNYMNTKINSNVSINEISLHCSISPTGLKRVFYRYSGLAVHKYFITLKINTATQLLKNGHSVSEVSEILGFANQAYFSAAFKRETGFSPSYFKSV